jgi:hypothetical protein
MAPSTFEVAISEKKKDVLDVDIMNQPLFYKLFDYVIYGKDNKMIRRGQFRAPSVQLRTTFMQEGDYLLQVLLNENEYVSVPFHKTSSLVNA